MSDFYEHFLRHGRRCFVIAEAGVNHNGDLKTALNMIEVAKRAGADAIKFQTFDPDELVSKSAPMAEYQKKNLNGNSTQHEMLSNIKLKYTDHAELINFCKELDIEFLSTPFENGSVDFLESLGVRAFKVGSGEITNLPLLGHVAEKGKAIILSTGMSNMDEVGAAVREIEKYQNTKIVLLHCLSQYPAPFSEMNLRAIVSLRKKFGYPVGLSDHTTGIEVGIASIALGASVIEKHFTLDKLMRGPDHLASLEPDELEAMIKGIRNVELALGDGEKTMMPSERDTARVARKSIVAGKFIPVGSQIEKADLKFKRPGTGIPPSELHSVIGKIAKVEIDQDEVIQMDQLC